MLDSRMLHGLARETQICTTCLLKFYMPTICEYAPCCLQVPCKLLPWTDDTSEGIVIITEGGRWRPLPSLLFNLSLANIPLTQDQVST